MTAYSADEALNETVMALECEHLACVEQRRLTEQARGVAAQLEAENHALRVLLAGRERHAFLAPVGDLFVSQRIHLAPVGDLFVSRRIHLALSRFITFGYLSAEALALAASLEES